MHHTLFLSVAALTFLSGCLNAVRAAQRRVRFGAMDAFLWLQRGLGCACTGVALLWFVELGSGWQLFINFNLTFWLWLIGCLAAGLLLELLIERATWLFYRKRFGIPR